MQGMYWKHQRAYSICTKPAIHCSKVWNLQSLVQLFYLILCLQSMTHQVTLGQRMYMRVALIQAMMATQIAATASCTMIHFPMHLFWRSPSVSQTHRKPDNSVTSCRRLIKRHRWLRRTSCCHRVFSGGSQTHQNPLSRCDLCDVRDRRVPCAASWKWNIAVTERTEVLV